MLRALDSVGRSATRGVDEMGYSGALLGECFYWIFAGRRRNQPVRAQAMFSQMVQIGLQALPIATMLAATIGVMLSIQGVYTLGLFGAQSYVYVGVGMAVVREFAPLIIGILVAGRSGSALAARLSTMTINQEIDALRAMGINPVRFLVAPALIGMIIMVPTLTIWAILVALFAAGIHVALTLDISVAAFLADVVSILDIHDVTHGLVKSVIFAVIIVLVAVVNGSMVKGGAEGVGRATTRSVVQGISAIVITDMIVVMLITP